MRKKVRLNKVFLLFTLVLALFFSTANALPDNTGVLHWTMDSVNGTVDQFGNNRNLDTGSGTTVAGMIDEAKLFTPSNGYVSNYGSGVDPNDRTYCLWFNKSVAWSYVVPIGQWGGVGAASWMMNTLQTGIRVQVHTGSVNYNDLVPINLSLGEWYHTCVYLNDTKFDVWVDGSYLGQGNLTAGASSTPNNNIGVAAGDSDMKYDGSVDDIRIYEGRLDDAEVLSLYEIGVPPPILTQALDVNLSRYFSFDNSTISGTNIGDLTGTYNGTMINSPGTGEPGISGESMNFATNFASGNVLNIGASGLTYSENLTYNIWAYHTSDDSVNSQLIFDYIGTTYRGDLHQLGNDMSARIVANPETPVVSCTDCVDYDTWTMWTFTASITGSTGTIKLYKNGQLMNTTVKSLSPVLWYGYNQVDAIGGRANSQTYIFNGSVDEFGFWNREFSAQDVSDLFDYYNYSTPIPDSTPVPDWVIYNITWDGRADSGDVTPEWLEQNTASTALNWTITNGQLRGLFSTVLQDNHLDLNLSINYSNINRFDFQVNITDNYNLNNPIINFYSGANSYLYCGIGWGLKLIQCYNGVSYEEMYGSYTEGQVYNISIRNIDWVGQTSDFYVNDVYVGTHNNRDSGIPTAFRWQGNGYSDTGDLWTDNYFWGYEAQPEPNYYHIEDFNRANGPLGENWTLYDEGVGSTNASILNQMFYMPQGTGEVDHHYIGLTNLSDVNNVTRIDFKFKSDTNEAGNNFQMSFSPYGASLGTFALADIRLYCQIQGNFVFGCAQGTGSGAIASTSYLLNWSDYTLGTWINVSYRNMDETSADVYLNDVYQGNFRYITDGQVHHWNTKTKDTGNRASVYLDDITFYQAIVVPPTPPISSPLLFYDDGSSFNTTIWDNTVNSGSVCTNDGSKYTCNGNNAWMRSQDWQTTFGFDPTKHFNLTFDVTNAANVEWMTWSIGQPTYPRYDFSLPNMFGGRFTNPTRFTFRLPDGTTLNNNPFTPPQTVSYIYDPHEGYFVYQNGVLILNTTNTTSFNWSHFYIGDIEDANIGESLYIDNISLLFYNLSNEDVSLENNYGSINYHEGLDLTDYPDYLDSIQISHNRISVDSNAVPPLNSTADVIFSGSGFVTLNDFELLKDGVACTSCTNISITGGNISFTTTSFSNITANSTWNLTYEENFEGGVNGNDYPCDFEVHNQPDAGIWKYSSTDAFEGSLSVDQTRYTDSFCALPVQLDYTNNQYKVTYYSKITTSLYNAYNGLMMINTNVSAGPNGYNGKYLWQNFFATSATNHYFVMQTGLYGSASQNITGTVSPGLISWLYNEFFINSTCVRRDIYDATTMTLIDSYPCTYPPAPETSGFDLGMFVSQQSSTHNYYDDIKVYQLIEEPVPITIPDAVHEFPFDTLSGANDTIGNITGASIGATLDISDNCFSGECYDFDGTGYITLSNPLFSQQTQPQVTVRCMFLSDTPVSSLDSQPYDAIFGNTHNSFETGAFVGLVNYSGTGYHTALSVTYPGSAQVVTNSSIDLNNWHMVTWVYDGNAGSDYTQMYLDGVLLDELTADAQMSTNANLADANYFAQFNNVYGNDFKWHGKLDECKVWDTPLTSEQVALDYTQVLASQNIPNHVIVDYEFNGNGSDSSGRGNDVITNNGAVYDTTFVDFNSQGDNLLIPLNMWSEDQFTIEVRFRPDGTGDDREAIYGTVAGNICDDGFQIRNDYGTIMITEACNPINTTIPVTDNEWTKFTMTYNKTGASTSVMKFYKNDVLISTVNDANGYGDGILTNSADFYSDGGDRLGTQRDENSNYNFVGEIDYFKIYDVVLEPSLPTPTFYLPLKTDSNDYFGNYNFTNNGVTFNGISGDFESTENDRLNYSNPPIITGVTGDFSLCSNVNAESLSAGTPYNVIFEEQDTSSDGFILRQFFGNFNIWYRDASIGDTNLAGNLTPVVDTDYSVCIVFDNSTNILQLYVDGALDGQVTTNGIVQNVDSEINVGTFSTNYWDGRIWEMCGWTQALTSDQILLYNSTGCIGTLEVIDLSNVSVSKYDINGQVVWLNNLDLTGYPNYLDSIVIDFNNIYVDTITVPPLNDTADLTFYNTGYYALSDFYVYKDGVPCTVCSDIAVDVDGNVSVRTTSFSNITLVPQPEHYYPADTNGTFEDVIGTKNGTINGSTYVTNGISNGAYDFEFDNNNYVDLGTQYPASDSDFSFSVWFNAESWNIVNDGNLISSGITNGQYWGWQVRTQPGPVLQFRVRGNGTEGTINTDILDTNQWYLMVGTYNATSDEMKLYLDGKEIGTASSPFNISTTNNKLHVGGETANLNREFDGLIDEVRLYNTILSSDEVLLLYDGLGPAVAYYQYETDYLDSSDYGNDATNGGTNIVSGYVGYGVNYEAENLDYITVPHDNTLNFTTRFAMSAWIYPTSFNGQNRILSKYESAPSYKGLGVSIRNDGGYNCPANHTCLTFVDEGDAALATQVYNLTLNEWQHIAVSFDGTTTYLYINGQEESFNATTPNVFGTTADMRLGIQQALVDAPFNGTMDEFIVYNRNLTREEVAVLAATSYAPATFTLNSDLEDTNSIEYNVTIHYNVSLENTDLGEIGNCSLYVDDVLNQTDESVNMTQPQSFVYTYPYPGELNTHNLSITCTNSYLTDSTSTYYHTVYPGYTYTQPGYLIFADDFEDGSFNTTLWGNPLVSWFRCVESNGIMTCDGLGSDSRLMSSDWRENLNFESEKYFQLDFDIVYATGAECFSFVKDTPTNINDATHRCLLQDDKFGIHSQRSRYYTETPHTTYFVDSVSVDENLLTDLGIPDDYGNPIIQKKRTTLIYNETGYYVISENDNPFAGPVTKLFTTASPGELNYFMAGDWGETVYSGGFSLDNFTLTYLEPTLVIDTNLIDNTINYNEPNLTIEYSGELFGVSQTTFNCSLYINEVINETQNDVDLSTTQTFVQYFDADTTSDFNYRVYCENSEANDTTVNFLYRVDTIIPGIASNYNEYNGLTFQWASDGNPDDLINISTYYFDENDYAINETIICNGNVVFNNFEENVSWTNKTTEYLWNASFFNTTSCDVILQNWDSHTSPNPVKNLTWYFDNNNLIAEDDIAWEGDFKELTGLGDPATYFYLSPDGTKYKLKMTFNEQGFNHTINISSPSGNLNFRPNDGYLGHFVYFPTTRWIDHEGTNIKNVTVTDLGNDKWNLFIEHYNETDEVEFESIGDLNNNTKLYSFDVEEIPTQPYIISPNGGEIIYREDGTNINFTESTYNSTEDVNYTLAWSDDGGVTWSDVGENVYDTITGPDVVVTNSYTTITFVPNETIELTRLKLMARTVCNIIVDGIRYTSYDYIGLIQIKDENDTVLYTSSPTDAYTDMPSPLECEGYPSVWRFNQLNFDIDNFQLNAGQLYKITRLNGTYNTYYPKNQVKTDTDFWNFTAVGEIYKPYVTVWTRPVQQVFSIIDDGSTRHAYWDTSSLEKGTDYLVRVKAWVNPETLYDQSNLTFTLTDPITQPVITDPLAGDVLISSPYRIDWDMSTGGLNDIDYNVSYSEDNSSWIFIGSPVETISYQNNFGFGSSGAYIPTYRVVPQEDVIVTTITITGSGDFILRKDNPTSGEVIINSTYDSIDSPYGYLHNVNQILYAGETYYIPPIAGWQSGGYSDDAPEITDGVLLIDRYSGSGNLRGLRIRTMPTYYSWDISALSDGYPYYVKVIADDNVVSSPEDTEGPFRINVVAPTSPTVTYPNGGESLQGQSGTGIYTITWDSSTSELPVNYSLSYSSNSGLTWSYLDTVSPIGDYMYDWTSGWTAPGISDNVYHGYTVVPLHTVALKSVTVQLDDTLYNPGSKAVLIDPDTETILAQTTTRINLTNYQEKWVFADNVILQEGTTYYIGVRPGYYVTNKAQSWTATDKDNLRFISTSFYNAGTNAFVSSLNDRHRLITEIETIALDYDWDISNMVTYPAATTYKVMVNASDGYLSTSDSSDTDFEIIQNLPPYDPVILNPLNNSMSGASIIPIIYSGYDADNITGTLWFEVYLDSNPDPTTLVQNSTLTTYGFGDSDGTYYVKVRSYDGIAYSNFSGVTKFIKNTTAPVVTLDDPRNLQDLVHVTYNSQVEVDFDYYVTSAYDIDYCNLFIKGVHVATDDNVSTTEKNKIEYAVSQDDDYTWYMGCYDEYGNYARSADTWSFTMRILDPAGAGSGAQDASKTQEIPIVDDGSKEGLPGEQTPYDKINDKINEARDTLSEVTGERMSALERLWSKVPLVGSLDFKQVLLGSIILILVWQFIYKTPVKRRIT